VAVKIQFPTLRTQFERDLFVLRHLIRFCDQMLEWNDYKDTNIVKRYDIFSEALHKV
jgi:predicted unusual protein kinase regulating ubiquinone biosynthesis (AarF/ABC1/UbiB family)